MSAPAHSMFTPAAKATAEKLGLVRSESDNNDCSVRTTNRKSNLRFRPQ